MTDALTLKQKTLSGLKWSFLDNFINQGAQFIAGIILARLLSPKEFGLVGMIAIFTAISIAFIDSGFSQALVRKNDCTGEDYSTVFFYNLAAGICFYVALFFLSGTIGDFYREPIVPLLLKVLAIDVVIRSFCVVQQTILVKNINFKLQTNISLVSSVVSGIIGIAMAYSGWGVWSLVWKTISQSIVTAGLLWLWNDWRPGFVFNHQSFHSMFGFSSKLLASGLIDTFFTNIYYLVIGRIYSATELGYYTKADQFKNYPSQDINGMIQRVSYPVLASIQDDPVRLKRGYKGLIKNVMFISFVLMIGLSSIAKPMVMTLIGEKWIPLVPYLQLLCFSGMFYPLQSLNLNMLKVKGKSSLYLKLEIIKKILTVPTVLIGIFWGIKVMLLGMIVNALTSYFLNSYWSGKLIDYSMREQVLDIFPSLCVACVMGIFVAAAGWLLSAQQPILILLVQIVLGSLIVICIGQVVKLDVYLELRDILKNSVFNRTPVLSEK